jgi:hypothetical protein
MKTAAGYVTDDENIHWASISLAWDELKDA